jgi:hypothetical protein
MGLLIGLQRMVFDGFDLDGQVVASYLFEETP